MMIFSAVSGMCSRHCSFSSYKREIQTGVKSFRKRCVKYRSRTTYTCSTPKDIRTVADRSESEPWGRLSVKVNDLTKTKWKERQNIAWLDACIYVYAFILYRRVCICVSLRPILHRVYELELNRDLNFWGFLRSEWGISSFISLTPSLSFPLFHPYLNRQSMYHHVKLWSSRHVKKQSRLDLTACVCRTLCVPSTTVTTHVWRNDCPALAQVAPWDHGKCGHGRGPWCTDQRRKFLISIWFCFVGIFV